MGFARPKIWVEVGSTHCKYDIEYLRPSTSASLWRAYRTIVVIKPVIFVEAIVVIVVIIYAVVQCCCGCFVVVALLLLLLLLF